MSWFRPCLHESLCKTVKWHRVPVLSCRWWISVHHVEQAVIIQLTLKWSHSGIACSRDVSGHLKSYGISSSDEAILSELKLLLARAGILFTFYFFIVLRCIIKLCNGLS